MGELSSMEQSDLNHLSENERFSINQSANGAQPEKELQEIIDREGANSPAGQSAQMLLDVMPETIQKLQPIEDRKVLPMLITARNEEIALPQTVTTLMYSAMEFQKDHPGFHVAIVISNNASTDGTTAAVAQVYQEHKKKLISNHVSIEVIYEGKPGKINGIRKGVKHIEQRFAGRYTYVLSGDADVIWDKDAVNALWKVAHPGTGVQPLLVGSNVTPSNRKTIWGFLEHILYYGYGSLPPRNQGIFMRIVNGMGYLADKSVLHHWEDIPVEIGSDDTALSALVGSENIAIAPDAIVQYDLAEDFDNFMKIRGRHVRETSRIEKWLSQKYGEKKGVAMLSDVIDNNFFPIINHFLKPALAMEPPGSSLYENIKKIIRHIKSVPILNYPFMDIVVVLLFMPFAYGSLMCRGLMQIYKVSWWVALIGSGRKSFELPYVTFLLNRESKEEEKAQVASTTQGILWNPALQRKSQETVQNEKVMSPVREFFSNSLNWAYAIVLVIEAFIAEFILRHFFLFISEKSSAIAVKMPTSDMDISNSKQVLYGTFTNMKGWDTLSETTSFIGQHILLIFVVFCLILYICFFIFHSLQSIRSEKNSGANLVDLLKSTSRDFFNIAALPFMILEKVIVWLIATLSTLLRLMMKKGSHS